MLRKLLQNKNKRAKRIIPVSWRKLIPGIALIGIGILFGFMYMNDNTNMITGVVAALALAAGGWLVKQSFESGEAGFSFSGDGKRKQTGNENAILIVAKNNASVPGKEVPVTLKFIDLKKIPSGARLHYLRNLKKHYYEILYNPKTHKLEPVVLPDKQSFPPGLFQIPAAMQPYKEAIEYSPPTMFQKIAPGIILLGMVIVGILMVMTGGE